MTQANTKSRPIPVLPQAEFVKVAAAVDVRRVMRTRAEAATTPDRHSTPYSSEDAHTMQLEAEEYYRIQQEVKAICVTMRDMALNLLKGGDFDSGELGDFIDTMQGYGDEIIGHYNTLLSMEGNAGTDCGGEGCGECDACQWEQFQEDAAAEDDVEDDVAAEAWEDEQDRLLALRLEQREREKQLIDASLGIDDDSDATGALDTQYGPLH